MTSRFFTGIILALPLLFYLLALNPYLAPDTYDNVVYFEGAQSLAHQGTYQSGGEWITDWPPMMSSLLALPMLLGFDSVWAAKVVVLVTVALGIFFAYRLLEQEERPLPLLSCFLCLITPVGFLWGGRVMTEWPYLCLSFLFLIGLGKLRRHYSLALVFGCGILFGASLLTRYMGVALVAALAVQAWERLRSGDSKRFWPEASVLAIGGALFTGFWLIPWFWIRRFLGVASKYYENWDFLQWPNISALFTALRDFFFFDSAWASNSKLWIIALALLCTAFFTLWGLALSFYRGRHRPTDAYVSVVLLLFVFHDTHWTRYVLVVGPLLFSYLFLGTQMLWSHPKWRVFTRGLLLAYVLGLLSMDVYLLARGNGRTYNGLSYLASPTADAYYAGNWRDLYVLSQKLAKNPEKGAIAIYDLGETRYIHYFTGRQVVPFDSNQNTRFVMASKDSDLLRRYPDRGLTVMDTVGAYAVYEFGKS